jgi:hypothetical protein
MFRIEPVCSQIGGIDFFGVADFDGDRKPDLNQVPAREGWSNNGDIYEHEAACNSVRRGIPLYLHVRLHSAWRDPEERLSANSAALAN